MESMTMLKTMTAWKFSSMSLCLNFAKCSFSSTTAFGSNNHYQTLKIPLNASRKQIKDAYYKLSKELHPDVNKSPGAVEAFRAVNEAYHVLGHRATKVSYDSSIRNSCSSKSSFDDDEYDPRYASEADIRRRMVNEAKREKRKERHVKDWFMYDEDDALHHEHERYRKWEASFRGQSRQKSWLGPTGHQASCQTRVR